MTTNICGCSGITLSANASIVIAGGQPKSICLIDTASNAVINSTAVKIQNTTSSFSISTCRITFTDGTYMNSAAIVGPLGLTSPTNTQTFTSSSTWVKPSSGKFVIVRLWGGGGSGGAIGGNPSDVAFGGGGGAFHEAVFNIACLTANVTVTVGAGGAGVNSTSGIPSFGKDGGNTSFGLYLTASGGFGGSGSSAGGNVSKGGSSTNTINEVIVPMISFGLSNSTSNSTAITSNLQFIYAVANPRNGPGGNSAFGANINSTFGGGAGGICGKGGNTIFGGGGGGRACVNCLGCTSVYVGGISTYGGNGSSGAASLTCATSLVGLAPGGGSGGAAARGTATSANGAAGRAIVYVY